MSQKDSLNLLHTARTYILDLASSLENACEDFDFEGNEEDDPRATVEVKEAREFAERIEKHLKRHEAKP